VTVPFLGVTWGVFIGITVVMFGLAALMTGQALARTWRPLWHAVPYAMLLAVGARFLAWSLFGGRILVTGWIVDSAVLLVLVALAYRATRARQMATQYPWLYERAGIFSWREKAPSA
jgi:hypothetical protein